MVNSPGRSSGSWFTLLPAPSHPIREALLVVREAQSNPILRDTLHEIRFTPTRQWLSRVSSPHTAAGPRGTCTLFPYPGITM